MSYGNKTNCFGQPGFGCTEYRIGLYAAHYGYHLARQLQANVLLCHALTIPAALPQTAWVSLSDSEREGMMQDSKQALLRLAQELEGHARGAGFKPKIRHAISAGSVAAVVREQVLQHPAQMIIMGTHTASALATFLLGNHCRQLRESQDQPILLVPQAASATALKRIAFASDFSDPVQDMAAINALVSMAKKVGASLVLTHIYNDQNHSADFLQWTKHLLLEFIERAGEAKIDYMVVEDRQVEHGLGVLIRHEHIDMLAMVHHEHSLIYELLHESHRQEMADERFVPLLIFKSQTR